MSFEISLMTFRQDGSDDFDRAIVERAFKDITVNQEGDYWNLRLPGGDMVSAAVYIEDQPKISGFFVTRPPALSYFPTFWDAMFEVMRQTRTLLQWPAGEEGEPPYCVANLALVPDLPSEFIEHFGSPQIVSSGAEIDAAIERSDA